ncbi:MAG: ABC transporter substrate-binding protein [Halanaeroarchaeum sp.]
MQRSRDETQGTASNRTATTTRRGVLAAAGVGIATSLAGCIGGTSAGDPSTGGTSDGTTTERQLTDVVYRGRFKRVGLAPAVNDAAIAKGIWEELGLDVSYETTSGGQAAAKSVASGKDQFGNGGITAVMQLIEQGAPLKVIGQIAGPMGGVVSLEEAGITEWTDLEGKTVGRYPFGATGPAAEAAMRRSGVDVETVQFRNVQPGSGLKLLLNGTVDAMIKYFPQMKDRLAYEGRSANVLKTRDVLHHLGITLYTRQDVIDEHPDRVDAFVKGWLNAFQFWATNLDEAIELYKPLMVGDPNMDLERKTVPELYASQAPSKDIGLEHGKGWTPIDGVERTIEVFSETDLLEGGVTADEVFTNRFIEANEDLAIETAKSLYAALENYDIGPDYI